MNKRIYQSVVCSLLLLLATMSWADTSPVYEMNPPNSGENAPLVTSTLVTDVTTVAPGESFRVGVHYKLLKKWHIYWEHPGSTGKPTKLVLKASGGVTLGAVQMPAPVFFPGPEGKGIWTNGYEKEVLFFAEATVPADAKVGDVIKIEAVSKWLACDENCLPENNAVMGLELRIDTETVANDRRAAFDDARKRVPATNDQLVVKTELSPKNPAAKAKWTYEVTFTDKAGQTLTNPVFTPGPSKGLKIKTLNLASSGAEIKLSMAGKTGRKGQRGVFGGVLSYDTGGKRHYSTVVLPFGAKGSAVQPADCPEVTLDAAAAPAATGPVNLEPPAEIRELGSAGEEEEESFLLMLLFAFLGGLILNIMPCVLPVLSIKIFSLLEQSGDDRKTIRNHGLIYTAGVLVCFGALSIPFMLTPQSWGFQMQNPIYLASLTTVVFAFALSLLGVFEVALPGTNAMNSAVAKQHGYSSSFVYGIFAVLLGTPCTAPLLAPALAFLLKQSPLEVFIGLQAVGLGLAFPFLTLGFVPAWSKWLPKPGAWMETFKSLMGFLLVATALWLMSSLPKQITPDALMNFVYFLGLVGLAAWIYGHWGSPIREASTRWRAIIVALAVVAGGGSLLLGLESAENTGSGQADPEFVYGPAVTGEDIHWRSFANVDVKTLSKKGYTVFIDFTADWCVTCKTFEATIIDTDEIRTAFKENNIIPVQADFTKKDKFIKKWIDAAKRPGVPVWLVVAADNPEKAIVLPQTLTTSSLLEALKQAGPSRVQLGGSS
jgi:thiol:disulfide interchange protein/DsbC/DsbD-like thiol-disulfide interchange protein